MLHRLIDKVHAFWNWLTLADYQTAKERGTMDIIAHYGRGNVMLQNGAIIDEAARDRLSQEGDRALIKLKRRLRSA